MRFIYCWFYIVSMMLFSGLSFAVPVQYEATRVGSGTYTTTGYAKPVTIKFATAGVPKYQQIVPYVPPTTLTKFAKSALRGGVAGIAITGAIEGLGYLIDQATGDVKKVETTIVPGPVSGNSTSSGLGPGTNGGDQSICSGGQFVYYFPNGCQVYTCPVSHPYWIPSRRGSCFTNGEEPTIQEDVIDLDPSDWARVDGALDGLSNSAKDSLINRILRAVGISGRSDTNDFPADVTSSNTKTKQLYEDWPQLHDALKLALNARLAEFLASNNPEFEVTPEIQDQIDQGLFAPPPVTPPGEVVLDFELPDFCTWASWVCKAFIATDHPDIPMMDIEEPTYDAGLPTNASCPAPVSVTLSIFGTHELSYQPICDLASAIRIPVIAISYLISAFIVVGVRR